MHDGRRRRQRVEEEAEQDQQVDEAREPRERAERDTCDQQADQHHAGQHSERQPGRARSTRRARARPAAMSLVPGQRRCTGESPGTSRRKVSSASRRLRAARRRGRLRAPVTAGSPARTSMVIGSARPVVGDPTAGELDLAVDELGGKITVVRHAHQREARARRAAASAPRSGRRAPARRDRRTARRARARAAARRAHPRARPGAPDRRSTRRRAAVRSRSGRSRRRPTTATRRRRRARRRGHLGRDRRAQELQARVLERDADLARPRRASGRPSMRASPSLGSSRPGEHPRQRRLARSVVADDQHRLAAVDAQVHVGERAVRPRRSPRVHVTDAAQDEQRIAARRGGASTRPLPARPRSARARRRPDRASSAIVRSAAALSSGAVRHVHDGHAVVRSRASAAAR